jgi:tripartite-type tricarboxylate transporter receptor subunit TctC
MTDTAYWNALLIPSKTPQAIAHKLRTAMAQINASPEMKARLEKLELEPWPGTIDEFEVYLDKFAASLAEDFKRMNNPMLD